MKTFISFAKRCKWDFYIFVAMITFAAAANPRAFFIAIGLIICFVTFLAKRGAFDETDNETNKEIDAQ